MSDYSELAKTLMQTEPPKEWRRMPGGSISETRGEYFEWLIYRCEGCDFATYVRNEAISHSRHWNHRLQTYVKRGYPK